MTSSPLETKTGVSRATVSRRRFIKVAGAAGVVLVACGVAGYYALTKQGSSVTQKVTTTVTQSSRKSSAPTRQALSRPESCKRLSWMINVRALDALLEAGLPEILVKHFFDNQDTFLMGSGQTEDVTLQLHSMPTQVFTSFETLRQAFANNQIGPSTKAIVYDNEAWEFTPPNEQANPAIYEKRAAELVHDHSLTFICTPAVDLLKVLDPDTHEDDMYTQYLTLGIAADAARYSDIYEIQAQGSEINTDEFSQFVTSATQQARQANPNVIVLAGLSTGPSGKIATADELYDAATSVLDVVEGFWLNIPSKGQHCPSCTNPKPEVAVRFLQSLAVDGY